MVTCPNKRRNSSGFPFWLTFPLLVDLHSLGGKGRSFFFSRGGNQKKTSSFQSVFALPNLAGVSCLLERPVIENRLLLAFLPLTWSKPKEKTGERGNRKRRRHRLEILMFSSFLGSRKILNFARGRNGW